MKSIILKPWEIPPTLDGRKSQFRRPMKPQPEQIHQSLKESEILSFKEGYGPLSWLATQAPYQPSERLWVKETFALDRLKPQPREPKGPCGWGNPIYKATFRAMLKPICEGYSAWKSPVTMPQWASRLTIEITNVRVERVQAISEEDAKAEGVSGQCFGCLRPWPRIIEAGGCDICGREGRPFYCGSFRKQWSIDNGIESLKANPWVFVYDFKRVEEGQ